MTDAAILAIARFCAASIEKVNAFKCAKLTDVAVQPLHSCRRLQSLNLRSCDHITDADRGPALLSAQAEPGFRSHDYSSGHGTRGSAMHQASAH